VTGRREKSWGCSIDEGDGWRVSTARPSRNHRIAEASRERGGGKLEEGGSTPPDGPLKIIVISEQFAPSFGVKNVNRGSI